MITLSEDSITQGLHVSLGVNFVVVPVFFGMNVATAVVVSIGYALVKEFFVDIVFETPDTSGGWLGSFKDFCYYMVGVGVAIALIYAKFNI